MGDAHDERGWRAPTRRRRARTLALAAALHVAMLAALLHWQGRFERSRAATVVVGTTIWSVAPPRVTRAPMTAPVRATRTPREPRAAADKSVPAAPAPTAVAPPAETPITLAPLAAAAPASAASAPLPPLRLELSRDQIRQLEAGTPLTLAQQVPHDAPRSALQQLAPDDYSEKQLPGGITEVHVHGGCFRLVPSQQSQLDPFNPHPRLTGPCLKNF